MKTGYGRGNRWRYLPVLAWVGSLLGWGGAAVAGHPQILVRAEDRAAMLQKLEQAPWARQALERIRGRVEEVLQETEKEPEWLVSRLFMHWKTRYTQAICRNSRWVGGRGRAPVPTPRFAGARDWATPYAAPGRIGELKPYNEDEQGRIWLINRQTGQGEWVDAGQTGRIIETTNERIMQLAAEAAFLYWLTEDRRYAEMASHVLWTYMHGFSFVQPPEVPEDDRNMARIIGLTSFEVIHEGIMIPLGIAYDFLHDYLVTRGRDVRLIQEQLRRMARRVVEGGFAEGNWNLNQAMMIAYAGLALEEDERYADGQGREYFTKILLEADLPTQRGLVHVMQRGFDAQTGLWPEAAGYGFGSTGMVIELASLLAKQPAARSILQDPLLKRSVRSQIQMLYPHGYAVNAGDTDHKRLNARSLELLIAACREEGDAEGEAELTAALKAEMAGGRYRRAEAADLLALARYVAELRDVEAGGVRPWRTFWAAPLNIFIQRNLGPDPEHSLMAAMYGTDGGHVHANGLAIELYGAGLILGADPGRGSSYWQADFRDYYSQPPAHNTVIVNGRSNYPAYGPRRRSMRLMEVEPASGEDGLSPWISFAHAGFSYEEPAAEQERTLAVIRTGERSGFYFDVFRSRAQSPEGEFHDYLYHNMGQSLRLMDPQRDEAIEAAASSVLMEGGGLLKGYTYFKEERSVDWSEGFRAEFVTELPDKSQRVMAMWGLGQAGRRIFAVQGPANWAARSSMPRGFDQMPMPTLIVRQRGPAWERPFVMVFEPYIASEGPTVRAVRWYGRKEGDLAGCVVEGNSQEGPWRAILLEQAEPKSEWQNGDVRFAGRFGVLLYRGERLEHVYLGAGRKLEEGGGGLSVCGDEPGSAALWAEGECWRYGANAPMRARVVFSRASVQQASERTDWQIVCQLRTGQKMRLKPLAVEISPDGRSVVVTCELPAATDLKLSLEAARPSEP